MGQIKNIKLHIVTDIKSMFSQCLRKSCDVHGQKMEGAALTNTIASIKVVDLAEYASEIGTRVENLEQQRPPQQQQQIINRLENLEIALRREISARKKIEAETLLL